MAPKAPKKPTAVLKANSVPIPPSCTCSNKPYPHDAHGTPAPWNWEATHKIWAEEEKLKPRRTRVIVMNGELTVIHGN